MSLPDGQILSCRSAGPRRAIACLVFLALGLVQSQAGAQETRWSFSVVLGAHGTNMDDLDQGLYNAPLEGSAQILIREGGNNTGGEGEVIDQNETEIRNFRFDNPLNADNAATIAGVEFAWHPNERHAFFFGVSSWERTSIEVHTGNLPLQQFFINNVVNSERTGTISFTEYTLGWRYNFFRRPRFRLYSSLSIHEMFDIDYKEEWVFLFVNTPIEDLVGVRRDMVMEAQTASLFMGGVGLGGEWFLRDWLSLGLEASYLLSEGDFTLRDVKQRDDFVDNDLVFRDGMPYRRMSDGRLGYLRSDVPPEALENADTRESFYNKIRLNFDGWRFLFRVSLYY
ncbi:MAG TPA: hypothetical protein ENK48_07420 [Gammaproteobacteria bacterium]|nr:hypothetical protein [Gammaproteobacteria bacterium]